MACNLHHQPSTQHPCQEEPGLANAVGANDGETAGAPTLKQRVMLAFEEVSWLQLLFLTGTMHVFYRTCTEVGNENYGKFLWTRHGSHPEKQEAFAKAPQLYNVVHLSLNGK